MTGYKTSALAPSKALVKIERQPTKPVPIPTSSRKKKKMEKAKNELDLALESIRQVAEGEQWQGRVTLLDMKEPVEKAELEPMEKMEKVERFEPEDYDKFGVPKPRREDVSDEQFDLDTKEIFDAKAAGNGFMRKIERFNQLMACWKSMPDYDPNVKADLPWLEEKVGPYLDRRERNIKSMQQACPFHPSDPLKVLNPDTEFGPLYCKCPEEGCPVWCTTATAHVLLPELIEHTHPEVRAKITELRCKCGSVPRMRISRTDRNFHRIFLGCGQHQATPCGYFQWMHAPLWKPKRPAQPTLDRWQKTPVGESLGQKKARPQNFALGFTPPVFGETPKPAKSFEQLCDEQNAERTKYNLAPYSYDTYRQYGLGIF